MKRVIRRVPKVAAGIVAAFLVIIPSASAVTYVWEGTQQTVNVTDTDSYPYTMFLRGGDWGAAEFKAAGDWFYLLDASRDGMRIGVEWRVTSGSDAGRWGICYDSDGVTGSTDWKGCNKAFNAGNVTMRLGRCDGSVNPCGKPGTGSGWRDWTGWSTAYNPGYN